MIMGRHADARFYIARQRRQRDAACRLPASARWLPRQTPVAGERELTTGLSFGPLIDDAADAVREGRMARPVQDNLRDTALARLGFLRGLIIDRRRQAIDGRTASDERRRAQRHDERNDYGDRDG